MTESAGTPQKTEGILKELIRMGSNGGIIYKGVGRANKPTRDGEAPRASPQQESLYQA